MHLQVRNLGREWAFEVGIVDQAGRVGIVRLSTFQVNPDHSESMGETRQQTVPLLLFVLA